MVSSISICTGSEGEKLKRLSENSKFAPSDVSFKLKRPKVSGIRDFPEAFVQYDMHVDLLPMEDMVSASTDKKLLGRNVSAGDSDDDDSVEPFEIDVGFEEILADNETHILSCSSESEKVESMVSFDCMMFQTSLGDAESIEQLKTSELEGADFTDSILSACRLKVENKLEDQNPSQQVDRPSSLKMWNNDVPKPYFPRRKVAAVRDFPDAFEQVPSTITGVLNNAVVSVGTVGNSLDKTNIAGAADDEIEPFETDVGSPKAMDKC
ncbi:unnamed protein product [Ilex paraguariensis]|uniref:Uncharacterized protein n=1 Tax=Ilex paraguariensis TaxID=185542 RepID=A0ABC8TZC1_9AQUA